MRIALITALVSLVAGVAAILMGSVLFGLSLVAPGALGAYVAARLLERSDSGLASKAWNTRATIIATTKTAMT